MSDDRDRRIREALLDLTGERGYQELTVADIVERAGVEQADFDRRFAGGKEALCFAVFDEIATAFQADVVKAFEAHDSWRDSLRASAYAAVRFMRDHPREVGFGALHILAAGELAQVYREQQLQQWVDLIDLGRQELDDPDSMGRGVAEGVLGSIHGRLLKELENGGGTGSLEQFVPELMYIAVRPYLGHEVAREELKIPPPLARLPRGRHGLPRDFVTRNQRERLSTGTIAVVGRNGFNETTIAQICAAAGVSRRTFYAYFSSKEECYFAAYDTIVRHLRTETEAAAAEQAEWTARVGAKIRTGLEFFAANPQLAKFCLAVPQQAGEELAARYRLVSNRVIDYLREGIPPATRTPPEAVTASLAGGMTALVMRKVNSDEGDKLPELLPDLLELFLAPFLGRPGAVEIARSAA